VAAPEGACARAEQDGDRAIGGICDRQIQDAVAVEIPHRHRDRARSGDDVMM
jgi:hypothetical protein